MIKILFITQRSWVQTIPCSLVYKLATYHWKSLKESYNFVIGNISIKIYMKNLKAHKIFDTFVPQVT